MASLDLYIDDSGSRLPNRGANPPRNDGMDYFALGGIIIHSEDIGTIIGAHSAFTERWKLGGPLHSTKIRGRREAFSFLKADQGRADQFYTELNELILSLPIVALSCVIDRPGYLARYEGRHENPWLLCQTAFTILVERAAKYARRVDRELKIYFEEAGKAEDRALLAYMKELRTVGMPFTGSTTAGYENLAADSFRTIVRGEPNRVKKQVPMIQFADLVLYAMARGGYFPDYPPFRDLHARRRIMDAHLTAEEISTLGVKYSCWETARARVSPSP